MLSLTRRTASFCILFLLVFASATYAQQPGKKIQQIHSDTLSHSQSLISIAAKYLHTPYRSGGSSKRGFDCSGFVRYCFDKLNITLPHSSAAQAEKGNPVALNEAKPGDLIFFKGESTKTKRIGHVGIITEITPSYVRFIHSAWNGGIRYDLLSADYYQKRFVAIKRLID